MLILVAMVLLLGLDLVNGLDPKPVKTKTPLRRTFHHNLHVIEDEDFENTVVPAKDFLVLFVRHDL